MTEAQPFCFPVCDACREAPCPKAFKPKKKPNPHAPKTRDRPKRLKCGCLEDIPTFYLTELGKVKIHCPDHGYQEIYKPKEKKKEKLKNPNQTELEDIPPF